MSDPQRGSSLQSYANSQVAPGKTKEDIEKLLTRLGALGFRWSSRTTMPGEEILEAAIEWKARRIAFRLRAGYEDERQRKQRLRALYWYLKAKVEAIQFGLVDLEQEFLPYLITQGGRTFFDAMEERDLPLLLEAPAGDLPA